MSKDTKKSSPEKKPAKGSPSAAPKAVAKKPAAVTAVKRPKAVQKKPAAPSAAKSATAAAKPAKAAKGTTTILVQANVGFGNQVFVRGEGPGLSWDHGAPMQYRESNQWEWSTQGAKDEFLFKVLINDQVWAHGENDRAAPGETKVIHPAF